MYGGHNFYLIVGVYLLFQLWLMCVYAFASNCMYPPTFLSTFCPPYLPSSPRCRPLSSPNTECVGQSRRRMDRIASSAARSAMVTGDASALSSTVSAVLRKYGVTTSPVRASQAVKHRESRQEYAQEWEQCKLAAARVANKHTCRIRQLVCHFHPAFYLLTAHALRHRPSAGAGANAAAVRSTM